MSQTQKKGKLPPSHYRTRFVSDALLVKELNRVANSCSLEEWRAVFPVVIGFRLRPSQTCKCTREYLFSSQFCCKGMKKNWYYNHFPVKILLL